jgi:hypothetical protein
MLIPENIKGGGLSVDIYMRCKSKKYERFNILKIRYSEVGGDLQ